MRDLLRVPERDIQLRPMGRRWVTLRRNSSLGIFEWGIVAHGP
jgi:hypothetical protein